MGSYTVMKIGAATLQWKYAVPATATFLFDDEHLFYEEHTEPPNEDGSVDTYISGMGFRSTCADCLQLMHRHGYTAEFFGGIYESLTASYDNDISEQVAEQLYFANPEADEQVHQAALEEYWKSNPRRPGADELADYTDYLRVRLDEGDEDEYDYVEDIAMSLSNSQHLVAPSVLRVSALLDEETSVGSDVLTLLYLWLLLSASPPESAVEMDVSEIVED